METKVRKQIYLRRNQEENLKRLADFRGSSEAELIREALDLHLLRLQDDPGASWTDPGAWEKALAFMLALRKPGNLTIPRRRYSRDELYRERLDRYGRHSD